MTNINKAKNKLPYTFVPIELRSNSGATTIVNFNETKESYSGHLNCSLYALNQLIVGNKHYEIPINDKDHYTTVEPLKVNSKTLISPYTLKGAISGFLSAYLGEKMKRVNEQKFSFRPNIYLSNRDVKYAWGVGIVKKSNNSLKFIKIGGLTKFLDTSRTKYSHVTINDNVILDSNKLFALKSSKIQIDKGHAIEYRDFYCFRYQNGIDYLGHLLEEHLSHLTNAERETSKAKPHNSIGFELKKYKKAITNKKEYKIDKAKLIEFSKTIEYLKDYIEKHNSLTDEQKKEILSNENWGKISKFEIGNPIFYEYEVENPKNIITFGKTFYYPWAFDKGLNAKDFPNDIRKESELTILEEMFGYSFQNGEGVNESKSGKVHFNFAVPVSNYEIKNYILNRPGEPKPSSYEFYLQQKEQNKIQAYGEPLSSAENARLSGRKFYKTILDAKLSEEKEVPEKFNVKLNEVINASVNNPVEFKFRVNFENLTEYELKLLKFALTLDELSLEKVQNRITKSDNFFCHQIGYAKNYGIGAVKIIIASDTSKVYKGKNQTEWKISNSKLNISDLKEKLTKDDFLKKAFGVSKNDFHYPGQNNMNDDSKKIIKWHSSIRQEYAKLRRK